MSTPMDTTPVQPFSAGVASAAAPFEDPQAKAQECADVKQWFKKIERARKFDENSRKQYAKDRRYARGDSGTFEVDVPIAASYIQVLQTFLYARDPDLDVLPAASTEPPPADEVARMARQRLQQDPATEAQLHQIGDQAAAGATQQKASMVAQLTPIATHAIQQNGGQLPDVSKLPQVPQPPDPQQAGEAAIRGKFDELVKSATSKLAEPYQKRRDDAKQFGTTLELVISRLWKKAKLKEQAEPYVASALTIGIGWLKASWQERRGRDPVIQNQINDLQDNLRRVAMMRAALAEGDVADVDAQKADIEQEMQGLEAKVEVVLARGLAIDFVNAEDIQVAMNVRNVSCYKDAPWIAHRTFAPVDDAKVMCPGAAKRMDKATLYTARKPVDPAETRDVGSMADVTPTDADAFTKGAGGSLTIAEDGDVCIWEIWNRDSNMVITLIEGLDCYAVEPYAPQPGTTRFYPFFQFTIGMVDGERHPRSLITRSQRLLDEYNRTRSNFAEHRRRIKPKTAFDSSNIDEEQATKIESGGIQEMVGIKPLRPGTPMQNLLAPISYAPIDPALYDTAPIRAELEMIWGVQEALSSSIQTAKTATEAEIQDSGTKSRTSYMRDGLDMSMGELAEYTAEVAIQMMTRDDAVQIAGPYALWPEGIGIDDIDSLVTVDIRAGSSGKPDTARQRQAWATAFPLIQNAILQVGQLRKSTPEDVADCVEELIGETLERMGDRLDPARFLPSVPDASVASTSPAASAPAPAPVPTATPPMGESMNDPSGAINNANAA
jgi:hypothetical protein